MSKSPKVTSKKSRTALPKYTSFKVINVEYNEDQYQAFIRSVKAMQKEANSDDQSQSAVKTDYKL